MAKAKKLPSGKWMVQVYRNGVRKAFTDKDKFICQQKAAEWLASNPSSSDDDPPFHQAAISYNDSRRHILSPATMKEYDRMAENHFFPFSEISVSAIEQSDIQKYIDDLAKRSSPKTCRNIHGYIAAVMHSIRPNLALNTRMPQKVRLHYNIPTDGQIQALLKEIRGTKYELPIMLAAFGSLRRSEICALDASDVDRTNCTIHVRKAMLQVKGQRITKSPKTIAGDRYVKVPRHLIDLMPEKGLVCGGLSPNTLENYMPQLRRKYGLKCRLHDLRHYFASSQHAMGIPDVYIMAAGGWDSDEVLKRVYRNELDDVKEKMSAHAVSHYDKLIGR